MVDSLVFGVILFFSDPICEACGLPAAPLVVRVVLAVLCESLAAQIWALFGFGAKLGGVWYDGARPIHLQQWGKALSAEVAVPGGHQRLNGVVHGRVAYLMRRDYGEAHLLALGFPQQQVASLDGSLTGLFTLKLNKEKNRLEGSFRGRRFQFANGRQTFSSFEPGTPRVWTRVANAEADAPADA